MLTQSEVEFIIEDRSSDECQVMVEVEGKHYLKLKLNLKLTQCGKLIIKLTQRSSVV